MKSVCGRGGGGRGVASPVASPLKKHHLREQITNITAKLISFYLSPVIITIIIII